MKKVILSSESTYDIMLESINSDVMRKVEDAIINKKFNDDDLKNSIENLYNTDLPCKVDDIFVIGITNDISETKLQKFIKSKNNQNRNFYCHAKHDFSSDSIILHDSATSSFYCALQLLGKPKFAVIYRKDKRIVSDDNVVALGLNLINQTKYQNTPNIQNITNAKD